MLLAIVCFAAYATVAANAQANDACDDAMLTCLQIIYVALIIYIALIYEVAPQLYLTIWLAL